MRHLIKTALAILTLLLLAPALATVGSNAAEIIRDMETNTLIADINGTSETCQLNRVNSWGNAPSITFTRKDVRNEKLDSITLMVPGTPYAGNAIDTGASNVAEYGAGCVSYTNFLTGNAKVYEASFPVN